ncbi:MAG: alpha/beta fold hydrolase [Caulobacteraceae bacterium]|nr:alpha/beta fold hydrolase [Caulobacteraceae bacterium]
MVKIAAALAAMVLVSGAPGARAASAVGQWHGDLHPAPGATLRLALKLDQNSAGVWSGALESLDQGGGALPLADVEATSNSLSFTVPVAHGRFEGRWDARANAWAGQWAQGGRNLPMTFVSGPPQAQPKILGLDGAWEGTLDTSAGIKLRLALHFSTGPYGTSGRLDSLDQAAYGLPLADITHQGARVSFAVPSVGGTFEGTLGAGGKITGTWSQGGAGLPLTFAKRPAGAPEARLSRPQTPRPPYPYRVEDVAFDDAAGHDRLAGTLTLPPGKGPFPAVVLIAGSGAHDRDETIFGHRPFRVLADHLTRRGLAVLRYDKRGVGASTGDYASATTADFADDANAAVRFLAARRDIDGRRIGLIGHSEGGLIAPMVADRDRKVAFVVLMAGPAVNGADLLEAQQKRINEVMGLGGDRLAEASAEEARMIDIVRKSASPAQAAEALKAEADAVADRTGAPKELAEARAAELESPWFRSFLAYDPAPALQRLRIPVLALIGSVDVQVPADQNIPALRAALAQDRRATVEELPGLNHLFQPATTGAPGEYVEIETTIAPAALDTITQWILRTMGGGARAGS